VSTHMPPSPGLGIVIGLCAAIGIITVAATLAMGHRTFQSRDATEEYGRRLVTRTTEYLGPDVADTGMRFTMSRLACASCHIRAGAEPGELSLVAAVTGRHEKSIEDRINECMTRSMNGRPLPRDGAEMIAMVSWLRFLADEDEATSASQRRTHDPPAFKAPERPADPEAGERLFEKRCADCHGKDGAGLPASRNLADGYLFPPLWGSDSFSDGASMHRVLTAARFIKARMPLGRPDLDDDQALDVAAFIDSKARPHLTNFTAVNTTNQ
jgi:thiosulfate dehydrogenase